ncbi:hypothetical protein [Streptomyces specialis]|uniref:hypothetical protein n=1 Tax=Streptomyces specialis TaxID=498367 RepID=UPI00073F98A1|nr:hypothetical protein [Streptomyces specialis]
MVLPPPDEPALPAGGAFAPPPPEETGPQPAFPGFPTVPAYGPALPGAFAAGEPDPWGLDAAIEADRAAEAAAAAREGDDDEPEGPSSRSKLLYIGLLCGVLLGIVMARADEMPISINDEANGAEIDSPSESPFSSPPWSQGPETGAPPASGEEPPSEEESEPEESEQAPAGGQEPAQDPGANQPADTAEAPDPDTDRDTQPDPEPRRTTPPPDPDPTEEEPEEPVWEWPDQNGDCSVEWDSTCYWDPPSGYGD